MTAASDDARQVLTIKVLSGSDPAKVAETVAQEIITKGKMILRAIGAGALNQAVKAIAIARGLVAPDGIELVCYPAFVDVEVDGAERTATLLHVEPRDPGS